MFIRFFKANQPATLFAIPIVVILFWISALLHPFHADVETPMPLYGWIMNWINKLPQFSAPIIGITIVSFQAIYLNNLLNTHEVLYKKSYLPALFFAVFASAIPSLLWLHPSLFATLIILIVLGKVFSLYKNEKAFPITFDIGFLIAIATLIYVPSVIFLMVFYAALIVLRPFVWREWFVPLLGFCLPFFFWWVWLFWKNNPDELMSVIESNLHFENHSNILEFNKINALFLSVLGMFVALAFFKLAGNFFKNVIRSRNFQQVFLIMIPCILVPMLFFKNYFSEMSSFLIIPLSVFISYYFISVKKNWWLETIFLLLITSIIMLHRY